MRSPAHGGTFQHLKASTPLTSVDAGPMIDFMLLKPLRAGRQIRVVDHQGFHPHPGLICSGRFSKTGKISEIRYIFPSRSLASRIKANITALAFAACSRTQFPGRLACAAL